MVEIKNIFFMYIIFQENPTKKIMFFISNLYYTIYSLEDLILENLFKAVSES